MSPIHRAYNSNERYTNAGWRIPKNMSRFRNIFVLFVSVSNVVIAIYIVGYIAIEGVYALSEFLLLLWFGATGAASAFFLFRSGYDPKLGALVAQRKQLEEEVKIKALKDKATND